MAAYLLVHGAWHDERCWELLVPELRAYGHSVHTLTLPGHWDRPLGPYRVSLKRYGRAVCDAAEQIGEPLILVGHSMGGMVISQAAEMKPGLFKHMIYLAAYVPRLDRWTRTRDLALSDEATHMWPKLRTNWLSFTVEVLPDQATDLFYHDCHPRVAKRASDRLCHQSGRPLVEFLRTTSARCGSVPKTYIECLNDRVISLPLQRRMQQHSYFERVLSIHSSHSPFLSQTEHLVEMLHNIAGTTDQEVPPTLTFKNADLPAAPIRPVDDFTAPQERQH